MDIAFGQFGPFNQLGSTIHSESRSFTCAPLDWPGLVARLAAAHAARQILAARSDYRTMPCGSFAPACAPHVGAYLATGNRQLDEHSSGGVNQKSKVDSKPPGTIGLDGKGNGPTAVRGLP